MSSSNITRNTVEEQEPGRRITGICSGVTMLLLAVFASISVMCGYIQCAYTMQTGTDTYSYNWIFMIADIGIIAIVISMWRIYMSARVRILTSKRFRSLRHSLTFALILAFVVLFLYALDIVMHPRENWFITAGEEMGRRQLAVQMITGELCVLAVAFLCWFFSHKAGKGIRFAEKILDAKRNQLILNPGKTQGGRIQTKWKLPVTVTTMVFIYDIYTSMEFLYQLNASPLTSGWIYILASLSAIAAQTVAVVMCFRIRNPERKKEDITNIVIDPAGECVNQLNFTSQ